MAQLTPTGLIKVFGLVTAIMVIPMVGGAVVGLILDGALDTSPRFVLIGLAVGSLISAIGIWLLIRAGARRGYTDGTGRHDG
jgi:ABC-type enterobactin transport system permease subunit